MELKRKRQYSSCSALKKVGGSNICLNGFPVYPGCKDKPMARGPYNNVPCLCDTLAFRAFPDTGKPIQSKLRVDSGNK